MGNSVRPTRRNATLTDGGDARKDGGVFEGTYFTAVFPDGGEETYIEVAPPGPRDTQRQTFDVYAVLDCSASMGGKKLRAASEALRQVYVSPQVASMTVIRFGSSVAKEVVFSKATTSELPAFDADMGFSNFSAPLRKLEQVLAQRQASRNGHACRPEPLAIFLSDGVCYDCPREAINGLTPVLRKLDCPLMSVAITTDVKPDVMVAFAAMHGDLPLLVVSDADAEEILAEQMLENLPLDGTHARLSFRRHDTGADVETWDHRFTRGGNTLAFFAPAGVPFQDLDFTMSVVMNGEPVPATVRLRPAGSDTDDSVVQLTEYGHGLLRMARGIVGALIKGEVAREQGEARVVALRSLFLDRLDATVLKRAGDESSMIDAAADAKVIREARSRHTNLMRARRAPAMDIQSDFNELLETVRRKCFHETVAANSNQTMVAKSSTRFAQIARNTANKVMKTVTKETATQILQSYEDHGDGAREMAACIFWLCNPYEAMDCFSTLDQGDWVGRAVLVVPGKEAVLSCWRIDKVLVRPLNITKSVINLIQVDQTDGHRKAVVRGTGYPEFNSCLPMIAPHEHVGTVRLAIHCMKNSTEGQIALADMVCGSGQLYDAAMFNSVYVNAVLSSLVSASTEIEYDGACRALLTTIDISNTGGYPSYWAGIFQTLAGPGADQFVACKEPDAMPDVARAFLPIVCNDAAYEASEESVRDVCAKLLLRTAFDQTSTKLSIFSACGINTAHVLAACEAQAALLNDDDVTAIMGDAAVAATWAQAITPEVNCCNYRLHLSRVTLTYGLHRALRNAAGVPKPSSIVDGVMEGTISYSSLVDVLRFSLPSGSEAATLETIASIFGGCDGKQVLSDLLVVCCYGHDAAQTGAPKHDSRYIANGFDRLRRLGGVNANGLAAFADELRQESYACLFRKAIVSKFP